MAIGRAVGPCDAEVPVGKLPVEAVHPCFDAKVLARFGQALHLDDQARQYPGMMQLNHLWVAKAMLAGMQRGAAQNEVAQVAPSQIAADVLGKRLDVVVICA